MKNREKQLSDYQTVLLIFLLMFGLTTCTLKHQSSIDDLFEKSINRYENGSLDDSITYFNNILEIDPFNYRAYLYRGMAYINKKEQDRARSDFNKCIKIDPNRPDAYYELGFMTGNQGKYEEAIKLQTKAIEADSNFIKAYGSRASMNIMLNRVDQAIQDLNDAIFIDSENPILYILRGQALDLKGHCNAAIEDFEFAMILDPENINTNANIAWILATCPDDNFRDEEEALILASEELELEETHLTLHIMAAACAENRDFENAIIFQEKAINRLQEIIPAHKFEEMYREKQLKAYSNQLQSYKNHIPWHFRQ